MEHLEHKHDYEYIKYQFKNGKFHFGRKCKVCNLQRFIRRSQVPKTINKAEMNVTMSFNAKVQLGILSVKEKTFKKSVKPNKKVKRKTLSFYDTNEWMSLRYSVLVKYGRKCMCCGCADSEIHVDHIKPRSLYPELELDFNNLQVLCKSCNLGKSNKDFTDFRVKNETL